MTRGRGFNSELFGPALWGVARRARGREARMCGGACLAGYWLHHRMVDQLEFQVPGPTQLESLKARIGGTPAFEVGGFCRLLIDEVEVDLIVEVGCPLEQGPEENEWGVSSLRDLAADRWLRLMGGRDFPTLVADLFFLDKARVDLKRAVSDMACLNPGCTARALATLLYETPLQRLPWGLLRPVTLQELEAFRQDWIARLGLETFR